MYPVIVISADVGTANEQAICDVIAVDNTTLDTWWDLPSFEMEVKFGENQSFWTSTCENRVTQCQPLNEII